MTQRPILFRGKRIDNDEWIEGSLGYSSRYRTNHITVHNRPTIPSDMSVEVDPATVGQFTGLTDKNGVNIFEGDCFGNDNIPIRHVVFEDGKFCFNRTHSQGADVLSQDRIGRLEIIGNIHTK